MTISPAGPRHMQQVRIKPLCDNSNSLKQEGTLVIITRAHGIVSADIA